MCALRRVAVLAVVVASCAVPSAALAHGPSRHGALLLSPALRLDGIDGGEAFGQAWAASYSRPASEDQPPCLRAGPHRRTLVVVGGSGAMCVADRRTSILVWGFSATCDDANPGTELYAVGEAAQRACAVNALRPLVDRIVVTIDGGRPVDLHRDRFGIFTPQFAVVIPPGNGNGPPGPATFTGYGWMAWLVGLSPGRHLVRSETFAIGETETHLEQMVVDVQPGRGRGWGR